MSSTYKDCQNLINSSSNFKMDTMDINGDISILPSNASPPDFDFNLPCRFFKSSFARSLSLNNASSNSSHNQCKSLDYDMRSINSNSNNNKLSCLQNKRDMTTTTTTAAAVVAAVAPLSQKRLSQAGSFYQPKKNEGNISSAEQKKQVFVETTSIAAVADDADNYNHNNNDYVKEEKPPALPARRPLSLHNASMSLNVCVNECQMNVEQKQPQTTKSYVLTQLRQQQKPQQQQKSGNNSNNNGNSIMPVNGNITNNNNQRAATLNQKPQLHQFIASNGSSGNCNSGIKNSNMSDNFRRNNTNNNHVVWPHQQKNVEQDCNICPFDQVGKDGDVEDFNTNYHDTTKSSTVSDYNNPLYNSHQILHMIPTINIHNNQQKHHQQQQQQQHQVSSYEMLNDNTTNVEAVILQNQVDTLQWQLKQVETSCDMYRAVMEEVARFLERYQSQKQLQQQQQQQQLQQMAIQKQHNSGGTISHNHNNNKMEQMPRSKSLFQVYIAGGHEKSASGNKNDLDETATSLSSTSSSSTSYLRARSSTNLIDLKPHQPSNGNCNGKSNDDHNFETGLTPSQSYSAFKDFTWRRSPKKSDSRLAAAKDEVEDKLNQEAFRLLRTIQNLLNTSQHQPDLAHHRHSLAPATALSMGCLSKAMSASSVMTLPGPPMLNSTSLTISANSATSSTSDSSNASPTILSGNNAASNNLAPEMLFLRTANMRDSRLSLRSSTDSSVHSTSSAASSASSKVETDEEASTPFHSPPNIHAHKQHHHLAGSSTEDESGFSSISSFPDIGVPLTSTMITSTPSGSKGRLMSNELKTLQANERDLQTSDSRNSTLKANVVGLPLNSSQDMSHRWDSPSKTYHNASNKFQRFSAVANEDSNTVLWV